MNEIDHPCHTWKFLSWLPAVLYMALIFASSSYASLPSLHEVSASDKLLHVLAYAPLGLFITYALSRSIPGVNWLFLGFILSLLYGTTDEIHQYFVPGRSASVFDLMADGLGALIGSSLLVLKLRSANQTNDLNEKRTT